MSAQRLSDEERDAEALRVQSATTVRISLSSTNADRLTLRTKQSPNPVLHWMTDANGGHLTTGAVQGISPTTAYFFAPRIHRFINREGIFVVPNDFPGRSETAGRRFQYLFQWMEVAFIENLDKADVMMPNEIDELLAYHLACNMLGMVSTVIQLEKAILRHIKYRSLSLPHMNVLWTHICTRYTLSTPYNTGITLPKGFIHHPAEILENFMININAVISRCYKKKNEDPTFRKQIFAIHTWSQGAANGAELQNMIEYARLAAHVEVTERSADLELRRQRFEEWLGENARRFGGREGIAAPMPSIAGLAWYDRVSEED